MSGIGLKNLLRLLQIQSSKIITSYAVSPQAVFTCPPCSTRYRRQGAETPRRYTYCSITSPTSRILCFSEVSGTKKEPKGQISSSSISLNKKASPIVHLDTFHVSCSENESISGNKLITVHENGTVNCYSESLQSFEWTAGIQQGYPAQEAAESAHVEVATALSVEQAKKTMLRNREDLLAKVEKSSDDLDGALLLVVSRSRQQGNASENNHLALQIFSLNAPDVETNMRSSTGRYLHQLTSLVIPEPQSLQSKSSQFTLHAASGTLYQLDERVMIIYDLTGSIPQIAHELKLGSTFSSCLHISPGLLASCTSRTLTIVDSTYHSLQDSFSFSHKSGASAATRTSEAPSDEPPSEGDAKLLSYFAPLGLVVALQGRKVLAFQLSSATTQGRRASKRKRDASLAASVGKGYSLAVKRSLDDDTSERKIKSLGTYLPPITASDGNHLGAELDTRSPQFSAEHFQRATLRALGSKSSPVPDKGKVYQSFSRMFSVETVHSADVSDTNAPRKLKVLFLQREICNSLIEAGFFTAHYIEMAMKHHGAMPFTSNLVTGALIQALAGWDRSLEILSSLLASPLPLSSEELVHILAIVTRSASGPEIEETPKFLTNGGSGNSDDNNSNKIQLTNGEDPNNSSSQGPKGSELDHHILNLTLKRLYAIPSTSIGPALKAELSTQQLRVLVDTLRLEIARNGWLSLYEDDFELVESGIQDNNQICYIAHLFNCVIDSVGTGGWVLGNSTTDQFTETANTIGYMKAEISAALEGIEEATYLKGMLGEILLCGKNSRQPSIKPPRPGQSQIAALSIKPLTIALNDESSSVLPLGLKPAPLVSKTRVGAGGELMRRSARDIGRLKSRAVGKYSFDRIII